MALGVLIGFFIARKTVLASGLSFGLVADLIFLLFVSGVIGARIFFVVQHFKTYQGNWRDIFLLSQGGLVWYGGFITASLSGLIYALIQKWPVLKLCDFVSPLLSLGQAFGRIGCFFNGCCFGKSTSMPWSVHFPGEPFARHPVQLYESLFLFFLSIVLFYLGSKKGKEGRVFIVYLLVYGLGRFFLEFLRGDQTLFLNFTLPQWSSLFLCLAGIGLIFLLRKRTV